jgi:acetyltransferase-like isoleucine patch superfamily enzyme
MALRIDSSLNLVIQKIRHLYQRLRRHYLGTLSSQNQEWLYWHADLRCIVIRKVSSLVATTLRNRLTFEYTLPFKATFLVFKTCILHLFSALARIYRNSLVMSNHPGLRCALSSSLEIQGELIIHGPVNVGQRSRLIVPLGAKLIFMGDNYILNDVLIAALQEIYIGRGTSVQDGCHIMGNICISEYCLLAPRVFMSSGTHSFKGSRSHSIPSWFLIRLQDQLIEKSEDTIAVGPDCWLGVNSTILPNTTLPHGCVVGANSVLRNHWTVPYLVFGGVPAKPIGRRWTDHSRMLPQSVQPGNISTGI